MGKTEKFLTKLNGRFEHFWYRLDLSILKKESFSLKCYKRIKDAMKKFWPKCQTKAHENGDK